MKKVCMPGIDGVFFKRLRCLFRRLFMACACSSSKPRARRRSIFYRAEETISSGCLWPMAGKNYAEKNKSEQRRRDLAWVMVVMTVLAADYIGHLAMNMDRNLYPR